MYQALPVQRPAGEAGATSSGWGRDPGGAVPLGIMEPGVTWYDVLGALPDAPLDDIREAWRARAAGLEPDMLAGASPEVLSAADQARRAMQEAWRVLADPATREAYDEEIGFRRPGEGLTSPSRGPQGPDVTLGPGWTEADQEALESYSGRADRVVLPDFRGLFYRACMDVAGRMGLRVAPVQLTAHPMPVEGLVVGQTPDPGKRVHHDSTLTVQVWFPPRRA